MDPRGGIYGVKGVIWTPRGGCMDPKGGMYGVKGVIGTPRGECMGLRGVYGPQGGDVWGWGYVVFLLLPR